MSTLAVRLTLIAVAAQLIYAAWTTQAAAQGLIFYVRPDGGSALQCTGAADAPYPGSGAGQPCAWDHPFRALPPGGAARIAGGDTLLIAPGAYMIGYGAPETEHCFAAGAFACTMLPIPGGPDAMHPTRILGDQLQPPELWGTERVAYVVDLTDASNVELGYLEITDHAPCVEFHAHGWGGSPFTCERDDAPFGPWASIGIQAEDSANVYLHDLDIHGLASIGVHAGRLTDWTVEDVRIAGNGMAGWDGDLWDDGGDVNAGALTFRRWTVEWNGCAETYPGGQPTACWAQPAGGYGDGFATGTSGGHWLVEDSVIRYNTSDGLDFLYVSEPDSSIVVRRTLVEGNAGNQIKTFRGPFTLENSIVVGNCGFFAGQPFTYAADYDHDGTPDSSVDNCRALGTALAIGLTAGDQASVVNNTVTSEGDCLVTAEASSPTNGDERVLLRNDIFAGQTDFLQPFEETCLVYEESFAADPFDLDYSVIDRVKHDPCPGAHSICGGGPGVVSAAVDAFDAHLPAGSPAIDAGTPGAAPADDFAGNGRDAQPDIGAYEYGSSPAATGTPTVTATPTEVTSGTWLPAILHGSARAATPTPTATRRP